MTVITDSSLNSYLRILYVFENINEGKPMLESHYTIYHKFSVTLYWNNTSKKVKMEYVPVWQYHFCMCLNFKVDFILQLISLRKLNLISTLHLNVFHFILIDYPSFIKLFITVFSLDFASSLRYQLSVCFKSFQFWIYGCNTRLLLNCIPESAVPLFVKVKFLDKISMITKFLVTWYKPIHNDEK